MNNSTRCLFALTICLLFSSILAAQNRVEPVSLNLGPIGGLSSAAAIVIAPVRVYATGDSFEAAKLRFGGDPRFFVFAAPQPGIQVPAEGMEIAVGFTALYHSLGNLPEPSPTHRFC